MPPMRLPVAIPGGDFFRSAENRIGSAFGRQTSDDMLGLPFIPIVEEISFGVENLKKHTARALTHFYNFIEDRERFEDARITFYLDTGMLASYYLSEWKRRIFNIESEYYYDPATYKRDIHVIFYGVGGALPTAQLTLKGCAPLHQEKFILKYTSDPKRMNITQTFSVDRVFWDSRMASAAILSTLSAGNPIGAVADQAAGIFSGAFAGGTYDDTTLF